MATYNVTYASDEVRIDTQLDTAREWHTLTTANINPERRAEIWKENSYLRAMWNHLGGDINLLADEFFLREHRESKHKPDQQGDLFGRGWEELEISLWNQECKMRREERLRARLQEHNPQKLQTVEIL